MAKYPGECPICRTAIYVGHDVARLGPGPHLAGIAHYLCAVAP